MNQDVIESLQSLNDPHLTHAAIEASESGVIITNGLDHGCKVTYVSPAFERITGYAAPEVLGRNLRFLHGDNRDQVGLKALKNLVASGEAGRTTLKNYKKDGTPFFVDLKLSPIRDSNNNITHFVGIQNDVTEREHIQQQLIQRDELLEALSTLQSPRIQTNAETKDIGDEAAQHRLYERLLSTFTHITESQFGFVALVPHSSEGHPRFNVVAVTPVSGANASCQFHNNNLDHQFGFYNMHDLMGRVLTSQDCVTNNNVMPAPGAHVLPNGYPEVRSFLGIPLFGVDRLVGLIGLANREKGYDQTIIDYIRPLTITSSNVLLANQAKKDHRAAEESARRSEKMETISRLIGGLCHDFNNLLCSVRLNLELAESITQDVPTKELIRRSLDSVERGSDLPRSLLAFARGQESQPKAIDLDEFIRDTLPVLKKAVGERIGVEVNLQAASIIEVDPSLLQSTILNLVLNARDAIEQNGTILIKTARLSGNEDEHQPLPTVPQVKLSVIDTGIGIEKENLERIFEPFFTLGKSEDHSGLGLNMVREFVERSNGRLSLKSKLGQGTQIDILWPCTEQKRDDELASPTAAQKNDAINHILLVEDQEDFGASLGDLLRSLGYVVNVVSTGTEAITHLRDSPQYDLVVSDLMMPGRLSGVDVERYAAALVPPIPTLLISGYAEERGPKDVGDENHKNVLFKPFGKDQLITRLSEFS